MEQKDLGDVKRNNVEGGSVKRGHTVLHEYYNNNAYMFQRVMLLIENVRHKIFLLTFPFGFFQFMETIGTLSDAASHTLLAFEPLMVKKINRKTPEKYKRNRNIIIYSTV